MEEATKHVVCRQLLCMLGSGEGHGLRLSILVWEDDHEVLTMEIV